MGRKSGKDGERGIVILIVAVMLLFVVGAMAVLAIDLVTFYTARSEAQLAANGGALAGARVLANSGMTSLPTDINLAASAQTLAEQIAKQVAANNRVGGRVLDPATEVVVDFPNQADATFGSNPHIRVQVSRADLPTFFARIFGRTQTAVSATATAEAYNPSGLASSATPGPPVAPVGVKPWLLPNLDPLTSSTIFTVADGTITNPALVGATVSGFFYPLCGTCTSPFPAPTKWEYYPGDPANFPPPTQLPSCNFSLNTAYEKGVAGVIQTPIACGSTVNIDAAPYPVLPGRPRDSARAINCMTHTLADKGDVVVDNPKITSGQPFRFFGGDDNPATNAVAQHIMVSNSLVTVPVFDSPSPPTTFNNPVTIIGFVQVFLNPTGVKAPVGGGAAPFFPVETTIVNLVGCGTTIPATQPVIGNGASAVPVRLIANP